MRRDRLMAVPVLVVVVLASLIGPAQARTAAMVAPSCASAGLTVTPLHGPRFYVDLSTTPILRGAYAGYRVTDTSGNGRQNLWVALSDFTGGSVALGAGQPSQQQIPTLAAGGSAAQFFYLTAAAESTSAQGHSVAVWQGRPDLPGSTQLCGTTGGFTSVDGTIKAAANKLTSVEVSTEEPRIGSSFSVIVKGSTGTIGSGTADDPSSFWMSPAALDDWPASAYRLEHTSLSFSTGDLYTDTLRVRDLASPSQDYTAVYSFRAVGFTSTASSVLPVQQIASGTQIKHTDLSSIASSLPAINPATNDMILTAAITPAQLPSSGGEAGVAVNVTGSAGGVLDTVEDTLPAGTVLVPGSVTWNGQPVDDGVLDGDTLVFQGPFTLTGTNDQLQFRVDVPPSAGSQGHSLVAHVGAAQIDSTLNLTDHAPATTSVTVNSAPDTDDDTASTTTDRAVDIDVLDNDSDVDGDIVTVTAVADPANGAASTDGTTVTYTPDAGSVGDDTFTYTVEDGRGGSTSGSVTVTVAPAPVDPPPTAPTAGDDTATVTAGQSVVIDVLSNDTGNGLTITDVTGDGATITDNATTITYTAPSTAGEHTIGYTVTDSSGATATASITITVTAADTPTDPPSDPPAPTDPPAANDDTATITAGQSVVIDVLSNDTGEQLHVTAVSSAAHGAATITPGGAIRYAPSDDFVGSDTFTYVVTDAEDRSAQATVDVMVTPAAGAVDDTAVMPWGTAVDIDVLANDPTDSRIAALTSAPKHGSAVVVDGGVRYKPVGTHVGRDTFRYRLIGSTTAATVTVSVRPPELRARPDRARTTRAAGGVVIPVLSNDVGERLAISSVGRADHGRISRTPAGLRYVPAVDFTGEDTVAYTVTDVVGRTDTTTVTIRVDNVAPKLAPFPVTSTVSDSMITVPVLAADADQDALRTQHADATGSPGAGGALTVHRVEDGSALRLRVDDDFSGRILLPVTVIDGHDGSATRTLRILATPRPATGVHAGVVSNPQAQERLHRPRFVDGRPVSRVLSRRVDSTVVWRRSPTGSVTSYEVFVGGERVCRTPDPAHGANASCTVKATALRPGDRVRVVAIGGDGVRSDRAAVPVSNSAEGHLVAVVYFPTGEFFLESSAVRTLATVVRQADSAGYSSVTMAGHTDSDGSEEFNLTLSRQRVEQVRQYLADRAADLHVATVSGYGETHPVMTNATGRGKAGNRRVEIYAH